MYYFFNHYSTQYCYDLKNKRCFSIKDKEIYLRALKVTFRNDYSLICSACIIGITASNSMQIINNSLCIKNARFHYMEVKYIHRL